MAEFIRTEEKVVNVGEPVIFENNTDSDFSVSAAIVFRKSGLYDVSIVGRRTIVSKVAKRKTGRWIVHYECPKCGEITKDFTEYCPFCNADMRGEAMDDSIKRQAALEAWKEDFKGFVNSLDMPRDDYKGIMEYIDDVPSAQPEPNIYLS